MTCASGPGRTPAGARTGRPACSSACHGAWSKVAAALLLALDRFEERLEVSLAEALGTVPLDQLEEHRRPVLHWPGENLQEIAVLVSVGEYPQLLQLLKRNAGVPDPVAQGVVITVRGRQETHASVLHVPDRSHDVVCGQRDVLDTWAAVELQVLIDLRLLLAHRGLVDGELDLPRSVSDDLAHEGGVLGGDVVADELLHV